MPRANTHNMIRSHVIPKQACRKQLLKQERALKLMNLGRWTAEGPQVPVSFDEAVLRNLCDIDVGFSLCAVALELACYDCNQESTRADASAAASSSSSPPSLQCGLPLLLDRLKQGCSSTKETSNFFRKRAAIEEEYARSSIRLARSSIDSYRESDGKAGSFVTSWSAFLRAHEMLGENHLKLATSLHEMADQLSELTREIERQRRNGKEVGSRLDKVLNDAEGSMDKARVRFDSSVEELERCLVSKAGESSYGRAPEFQQTNPNLSNSHSQSSSSHSLSLAQQAQQPNPPPSKRTFGKAMSKLKSGGKGGFSGRSEDELRSRMAIASDVYRKEVQFCQGVRREHWVVGIPRVLRTLKESSDEVDFGTQFHLSRYSHLFEQTILQDGMTVAPPGGIEDGPGLKAVVEALDSRDDFTKFMEHYTVAWAQSPAGQKGPAKRGDGMLDEDGYALVNHPHQQQSRAPSTGPPRSGSVSSMATNTQASQAGASSSKATFGVGLTDQMDRTGREVPKILEECATVIEEHGRSRRISKMLESLHADHSTIGADVTGIYRLSGTTSKIQKLKAKLDADVDSVNLSSPENLQDINDITGVLKLWFRELPEPLMTYEVSCVPSQANRQTDSAVSEYDRATMDLSRRPRSRILDCVISGHTSESTIYQTHTTRVSKLSWAI